VVCHTSRNTAQFYEPSVLQARGYDKHYTRYESSFVNCWSLLYNGNGRLHQVEVKKKVGSLKHISYVNNDLKFQKVKKRQIITKSLKNFIFRPTQYDEFNVYLCENVYDESRRIVRPLPQTGLKGYDYQSTVVIADEVFYFKSPIQPQKVKPSFSLERLFSIMNYNYFSMQELPTPSNSRLMMDVDNDDSLDAPASVGSTDNTMISHGNKKVRNHIHLFSKLEPSHPKTFISFIVFEASSHNKG